MRRSMVIGAVLALAVSACSPDGPSEPAVSVVVECIAFETSGADPAPVVRDLAVEAGQAFDVTICSNPSTGFAWEQPTWEGDATLEFVERSILQSVGGPPGEAGQERFTFKAASAGGATVHFVYSQPWDGGTKGAWLLDLAVTVTVE